MATKGEKAKRSFALAYLARFRTMEVYAHVQ